MTERPVAIVYGRFFLIYENFLSLRFLQQLQRTLNQSQYPLFFWVIGIVKRFALVDSTLPQSPPKWRRSPWTSVRFAEVTAALSAPRQCLAIPPRLRATEPTASGIPRNPNCFVSAGIVIPFPDCHSSTTSVTEYEYVTVGNLKRERNANDRQESS